MYFEWHGSANPNAPVVVCSSGLGGAAQFWSPQLKALSADYRVLLYDHKGTGRSPAPLPDDYTIAQMAEELLSLLVSLAVSRCHFIGHALGGLVGLRMAYVKPSLFDSLILINAWASANPHTLRCFAIRKSILANCEASVFLKMQSLLLYPPDYIAEHADLLEQEEARHEAHFPDKTNLLARISALSMFDMQAQLPEINTPILVLANKDDALVPWQQSKVLADGLPHGQLHLCDYGGHASTVTTPDKINTILLDYLNQATRKH
ncbi:pyrimidine utilization protein D [Alteromonas lipolytica]|uniref:Putative carbamate hydrolase RutD n=1 Tax=Alteromonas lipolytica TaxID=1856405 RepID=A0A1E8F8M8_9ALTE|nr:pyrimidine utilization protein D [Alteromonas lipolytica]OFI32265.1 pyrimidine utilization protein D [Alteromonas lipolytica]GGF85981.1 putative aminoacrylate hydrolase RutD [Alteromonas lipolytica]